MHAYSVFIIWITDIGIIVTKVKSMHVPQVCLNGGLQFNNYTNVWIVCTGTNMYSICDSLLGTLAKEQ